MILQSEVLSIGKTAEYMREPMPFILSKPVPLQHAELRIIFQADEYGKQILGNAHNKRCCAMPLQDEINAANMRRAIATAHTNGKHTPRPFLPMICASKPYNLFQIHIVQAHRMHQPHPYNWPAYVCTTYTKDGQVFMLKQFTKY